MINEELLKILACPVCKDALSAENSDYLVCVKCGKLFPVQNEVPLLLKERAIKRENC